MSSALQSQCSSILPRRQLRSLTCSTRSPPTSDRTPPSTVAPYRNGLRSYFHADQTPGSTFRGSDRKSGLPDDITSGKLISEPAPGSHRDSVMAHIGSSLRPTSPPEASMSHESRMSSIMICGYNRCLHPPDRANRRAEKTGDASPWSPMRTRRWCAASKMSLARGWSVEG